MMPLHYVDSVDVGDTTNFIDTLVSPISYPIVGISCRWESVRRSRFCILWNLSATADPQSGVAQQEDSLPFVIESIQPNPAQNEIAIMLSVRLEL